MGFYKAAIISVRSSLELGLLYVYYDREDNSETIIKEWLSSKEPTPFKKKIISGLTKIDNVAAFNFKIPILNQISDLYGLLSNYVHTSGYKYASRSLNKANFNRFNDKSLRKWLGYFVKTINYLTALFLCKYPIGLHYTPIDD